MAYIASVLFWLLVMDLENVEAGISVAWEKAYIFSPILYSLL